MKHTYAAYELTFRETPGTEDRKIVSSSRISSRNRLRLLLAKKPDHIFLDANWYVTEAGVFEGLLDRAPRDAIFVIDGYEEDWRSAKTPSNPLEIQMMSDFGPPTIHWYAQIEWSEEDQAWGVTREQSDQ